MKRFLVLSLILLAQLSLPHPLPQLLDDAHSLKLRPQTLSDSFHRTPSKRMSRLFHTLKLTEQCCHSHSKHTEAPKPRARTFPPVLLEPTAHLHTPVDFWCFARMPPRYSSVAATPGLQDLFLCKPHLQALVHKVQHPPS